ncbi:protein of unknown function [Georgfuchsia toluolica]|uniref:Uncharacterized protein n=1 Tax=Georgfuchsia toluolica TaxID=424218 RepID=A0A916NHS0_9PROT|nr:hypothetical protein [Georgfuchsia toluolica]CAG4883691.1 protein of unknown function [Georgfuchsia toluolica]
MATRRVIPITLIGDALRPFINPAHTQLERAGFMRMMVLGEPRLSEIVEKFKMRSYEVEVVPYVPEGVDDETAAQNEPLPISGTVYVRKLELIKP